MERPDRMEKRPSRDRRWTDPSAVLTGKAVLDSSPAMLSNRLPRSRRQSRLRYTLRMKLGCAQKSSRPCGRGKGSGLSCGRKN